MGNYLVNQLKYCYVQKFRTVIIYCNVLLKGIKLVSAEDPR